MRVLTAGVMAISKATVAPAFLANVTPTVTDAGRFREAFSAESESANSTVTYSDTPVVKARDVAAKPREEQHAVHEDEHNQGSKDASAAKKSTHKEDADASDAMAAPVVAAEQPVESVATPIVPVQAAIVDAAPTALTTPAVAEETTAAKIPQAVKCVAREGKKVEGAVVATAPTAKVDVAAAVPVAMVQMASAKVAEVAVGVAVGAVAGAHVAAVAKTVAAAASLPKAVQEPVQDSDIKTLIATPNVLEIGIASGTHGWLRVRAELGQMGEVTASLAATSAGAAEGLHKELPAISAYLAGERVGVSSLVVNAMDKGSSAQDAATNAGTSAGAGAQAGSDRRQGGAARAQSAGTGVEQGFDFGFTEVDLPAAVYANGSGSWLSVRV
jgi:hypothetical protein